MAFTRDHGQCCIFLPLKLGVGLISMITFSYGCFCMVSMLKSSFAGGSQHSMSINLQFGGYNPMFLRLSDYIGIAGIPLSFFGLLGIYDDKPTWIRVFLQFLQLNLLCSFIVFAADLSTLWSCEGFAGLPEDERPLNPALLELSSRHMCFWGRFAYILGFALETIVNVYFVYNVWRYNGQIELNPPYPIDFGFEKYDAVSRWKFFGVREPEEIPLYSGRQDQFEDEEARDDPWKKEYGPDGVKSKPSYSPDGFAGPAYIRGTVA